MSTIEQSIQTLRSYLDVKWRHQGRSRAGVDCVGLLVCAAGDMGLPLQDETNYGMRPGSSRLIRHILGQCQEVDARDIQTGDILLVSIKGEDPQHLMVMTGPDQVLHASAKHRKVVEHRLDDDARRGICKVFRPRGYDRG